MTALETVEGSTERRLLAAAERLFAEHGVGAVSLRAVMQQAGTNVAAVHYHFGSKQALLAAVVRSRIDQVTTERDTIIKGLADADAIGFHDLAGALVRPVVVVLESGGEHWLRLLGGLLRSGSGGLAEISTTFLDRNAEFVRLLGRLTPGTAPRALGFRLTQAMNITLDVLGDVERTRALMSADNDMWSRQDIIDDLLDVVTAILAGPPAFGSTPTTAK